MQKLMYDAATVRWLGQASERQKDIGTTEMYEITMKMVVLAQMKKVLLHHMMDDLPPFDDPILNKTAEFKAYMKKDDHAQPY